MPSGPRKDCSDWLIGELQLNLQLFDDSTTSLLQSQKKTFDACCALLREHAEVVKNQPRSSRSTRRRARELLMDVFKSLGPEAFLLCASGPSITKLGENASHIRFSTIRNWWDSALRPQGLALVAKELCKDCGIGSLVQLPQKRRVSEGHGANEHGSSKRNMTLIRSHSLSDEMHQEVPELSSNDPTLLATQEQLVLGKASLQGIPKVFNEYMCNAIRRVSVGNDSKAAITMVFPRWVGPVDCLMSLDICTRDVEQLTMALFGVKVEWIEQVLHVVLENGMVLTTETSEVTLKGVEDEAIDKVFGSEIHQAITECGVRRRESTEGKHVTECVSMILTRNGAIISLSLGLEGALQIEKKLYT
ncbi:hypothetical protein BCR34DRAFT_89943 [Clohesyomyces aquaticus]|uniref:Uncharacterized protein n=1 Tax=Clohesyomyces aquaticus TaxID=1231657 RepID=A0A1Y1YV38_9PLEO|nr:hypothetical protein BCR34DRAFT_89943 [Clohesyomyces aquaticus]